MAYSFHIFLYKIRKNNYRTGTSKLFDYFNIRVKNFADLTQIYVGQAKMKYKANNFVSGNIIYATRRGFHQKLSCRSTLLFL